YSNGVEVQPATVGVVDAGSPAWEKGIASGDAFVQIGDYHNPMFEQIKHEVALSGGKPIWIVFKEYGRPGEPEIGTTIEPRLGSDRLLPLIGFAPPDDLTLPPERYKKQFGSPVQELSPAAEAGFTWGDQIVGMTDPATNEVTALPMDPRYRNKEVPD